ncbi:MAG: tyrosine-type recombinase/integrase, partial [Butyrivibrio sp.]|nr:tyrosine-type recombinase/integrase [Butyrivibrio sp.]
CFERILQRPRPKIEPMINGYTGFLFLDMNGNPYVALHWEHYFKFIREKYAKYHNDTLPYVSPHVCRHTYCTNMARAGMNPKTLQYLMGHADISVTLNTYTHIGLEDAIKEVNRVSKFA